MADSGLEMSTRRQTMPVMDAKHYLRPEPVTPLFFGQSSQLVACFGGSSVRYVNTLINP
jgi:hypothetical protein